MIMIIETPEQHVSYVTNYLQNRFEYLMSNGRPEDAVSVYQELILEDDTHLDFENWTFVSTKENF